MDSGLGSWLSLEMKGLISLICGLTPITLLGRVLYLRQMVVDGRRDRFLIKDILWEVPTAVFCSILSVGVSSYFSNDLYVAVSVAGVLGWLGPRGLQWIMIKLVDRYSASKQNKEGM